MYRGGVQPDKGPRCYLGAGGSACEASERRLKARVGNSGLCRFMICMIRSSL